MATDPLEGELDARRRTGEGSNRALRILQAADELLAEHGQDAVSMRDVAQRAGVNKALIFYYFGSRAQLFEAVLDRYYSHHELALRAIDAARGTPRDRVHVALDAYLDFAEENALFTRLVYRELSHQEPQLEFIRVHLAKLHTALEQALGTALPRHGATAARQLVLTISGLVLNHGPYTQALGAALGQELGGTEVQAERRAHLHWLGDVILDGLQRGHA